MKPYVYRRFYTGPDSIYTRTWGAQATARLVPYVKA